MKTTYILGAGFSKTAGAPLQKDLIKKIFHFRRNFSESKSFKGDLDNLTKLIREARLIGLSNLKKISNRGYFYTFR